MPKILFVTGQYKDNEDTTLNMYHSLETTSNICHGTDDSCVCHWVDGSVCVGWRYGRQHLNYVTFGRGQPTDRRERKLDDGARSSKSELYEAILRISILCLCGLVVKSFACCHGDPSSNPASLHLL